MYSIYRLFKYTYFILLRSLQDISQSHIKYTENALLIYDDDDDGDNVVIIIVVDDNDGNNFENEEKVQL